MIAPVNLFRDPSKVLERIQEQQNQRPCSGCVHWTRLWGVVVCQKHEGRAGHAVQVCSDFERKAVKR